jgi:hypothetical protein
LIDVRRSEALETTFAQIPWELPEFDHVFVVTTTALTPGTYTGTYDINLYEKGPWPTPRIDQRKVVFTYTVLPAQ